jgi:hypothetical protein
MYHLVLFVNRPATSFYLQTIIAEDAPTGKHVEITLY